MDGRLRYFLENWKTNNKKQMGLISHLGGLQTRVCISCSPNRYKRNIRPDWTFTYFKSRIGRFIKKRCNRDGAVSRNKLWFLQHILSCPKKNEKMRPVIILRPLNKYLRKTHFSGHFIKGSESSETNRLDNFIRYERCLSACSRVSESQTVSPLLHKQKCYQFKVLCLGPTSAPRVFAKMVAVVVAYLREQNVTLSILSRRLASIKSDKQMSVTRPRKMPESFDFTGIQSEQGEIQPSTMPDNNLHRGVISFISRISVSNPRKGTETFG